MNEVKIGNYTVSCKKKPMIIAEMSGNHSGCLEKALKLVEEAAKSGAHAIKLQTYTADTMTLNINKPGFTISNPKSLWHNRHLYELYEEAHTPWSWHRPIMERAKELGITCFSTPFDESAVDFLEDLNVPAYKIASFENTDIQLIKKVCLTGKPIIISTGMASLSDLELMVQTLKESNCKNFILLKCTSAYPADPGEINLRTIPHLKEMFDCQVGLSDHTLGIGVPLAAIALGATVIEKHFCLSKKEGGIDSAFSLEPKELKSLVINSEVAWLSLGKVNYKCSKNEKESKQFRRSLYFVKDIKKGETITEDHIRAIRPGFGAKPKHLEKIVNTKATNNFRKGDPVVY